MLCNKCGKFPFCEHADVNIHECDKYVKSVVNLMKCDDEELKATSEKSLYEMDQEEKRLIKELKYIIADANLTSDWRTTIEDTIKLLENKQMKGN